MALRRLRRWKPFLGLFEHIDAAIEAAAGKGFISRDGFRRARGEIVEILCGAADECVAKRICLLLDDAMAEALLTLREAVPAALVKGLFASSGGLVPALGVLARGHGSERVSELARDVVRVLRVGVEEELAVARAAMEVLDGLCSQSPPVPPPKETAPPAFDDNAHGVKKMDAATIIPAKEARPRKAAVAPLVIRSSGCLKTAKASAPSSKMSAPAAARGTGGESKLEATKRKLHEGYREAEEAKRRRTIQVIQAPVQKQRKAPPAAVRRAWALAICPAARRRSASRSLLPRLAGCP